MGQGARAAVSSLSEIARGGRRKSWALCVAVCPLPSFSWVVAGEHKQHEAGKAHTELAIRR